MHHVDQSICNDAYIIHQVSVYKGDVAHIFFHPLITDPKVAFTGEANQAKGNNDGNHPIIIAFGLIRFTSKRHFRIRN
jgi:hypothetical protein